MTEAIAVLYPNSPDGLNGWYISEPELWIYTDETCDVYYQWNSSGGSWAEIPSVVPPSGTQVEIPSMGSNYLYYYPSGTSLGDMKVQRVAWENTLPSGEFLFPPTSGVSPGMYLSDKVSIQCSGSDDVSGVYQYIVRANEQLIANLYFPIDTFEWDTRTFSDGLVNLSLQVVDEAGNVSASGTYVYIGNQPPMLEVEPIPSVVFSSGLDVYGRTYHGFIPIDRVEYCYSSGEMSQADWYEGEILSTGEGGYCDVRWKVSLYNLENNGVYTTKIRSWTEAQVTQSDNEVFRKTFTVKYLE